MLTGVNQIALVTGATRGIGQAIALQLARLGATVVGTATSPAGAQIISQAFKSHQLPGVGMVLDVTDAAMVAEVLSQIEQNHGAIGVLVNNAGITKDGLLLRMKDTQWDDIITTNLNSVFQLSRACLRNMLQHRSGRIISISSVVAHMGNPGQCNYAAAKAGMEGFSRSLAREVARYGITVNVVAPGFIDTEMTKVLKEEHKAKMLEHVPIGRLGQPEDIANAVGFLASQEAGYITGVTLHVNGGMYLV